LQAYRYIQLNSSLPFTFLATQENNMTSLVRHHTRWCLLFTGALLVVAFSLHSAEAQRPPFTQPGGFAGRPAGFVGQPMGVIGQPGGFAGQPANFAGQPGGIVGQPGGVVGQPGGFVGQPAGFVGQPGGVIGQPSGFVGQPGGVTGRAGGFVGSPTIPGIGGTRYIYTCENCKREVGRFDLRCPHCGVRFSGTIDRTGQSLGGGIPGMTGPRSPIVGNPANAGMVPPIGARPPNVQPGFGGGPGERVTFNDPAQNAAPPVVPQAPPLEITTPPPSSSGSDSSKPSDEKSGLSAKVVIGVGVGVLGVFALIAGVVVVLNQGSSEKPKRRLNRFRG
jgi:hypothetical protein